MRRANTTSLVFPMWCGLVAQWLGRWTSDWRSRVQSQPMHCRVRPYGKLLTQIACHQAAVSWYCSVSWAVNRHTAQHSVHDTAASISLADGHRIGYQRRPIGKRAWVGVYCFTSYPPRGLGYSRTKSPCIPIDCSKKRQHHRSFF